MKLFTALALIFLALPAAARAEDALVTQNVHLRAGPDTTYPVVETVRLGEAVNLRGCVRGIIWCEVKTKNNESGWIHSRYLQTVRGGRTVTIFDQKADGGMHIVIFKQNDYWDRYYRSKYFYRDRDRWQDHKPVRPPKEPVKVEKPMSAYEKVQPSERRSFNKSREKLER